MPLKMLLPLLLLCTPVCAPAGAAPGFPIRAHAVADNVYAVITPVRTLPDATNRGWNSNSAFVVTDEGVMLFDSGSSLAIGGALRETIAGVTDQPVRWIINSHAHGDHWLGNAAFADTVETIYASTTVSETIQTDGPVWVERFNRMTGGATGDSPILPPTQRIDVETELRFGATRVVVFPSGNSHSPGDLLAWLPDSRVLLSGDVVYSDRMPSTNASDLQQWMVLLSELEGLEPRVVVPGHGQLTDVRGLTRLREMFSIIWQVVARGVDQGKAAYELVPEVSAALAPFEDDYPGLDEKLKRDIPHVYLQVEAARF